MTAPLNRRPRLVFALLLFGVAVAYTVAVGLDSSKPDGDITGITWRLERHEQQVVEERVTARFEDGTISGTDGCNSYGAPYQLAGTALEVGDVMRTLMLCLHPDGSIVRSVFPRAAGPYQVELSGRAPSRTLLLRSSDGTLEFIETP